METFAQKDKPMAEIYDAPNLQGIKLKNIEVTTFPL